LTGWDAEVVHTLEGRVRVPFNANNYSQPQAWLGGRGRDTGHQSRRTGGHRNLEKATTIDVFHCLSPF
jgi:hypothetical protein